MYLVYRYLKTIIDIYEKIELKDGHTHMRHSVRVPEHANHTTAGTHR